MKKILPVLAMALCLVGCAMDIWDERLQIYNSGNKSCQIVFSEKDSIPLHTWTDSIPSHDTIRVSKNGRNAWPYYVRSSENQQLHIFIISEETSNKNNWKKIVREKLYTYKSVPLAELEANDWLVEVEGK